MTEKEKKYSMTPWMTDVIANDVQQYPVVKAGNFTVIAKVGGVKPSMEEAEANARLMSAAPDLLEAMEALFENCQMVHTYWGENSNLIEADAAIAAARAAIRKAHGEEGQDD